MVSAKVIKFQTWSPGQLTHFFSLLNSQLWDGGVRVDNPDPWKATANYSTKNKRDALNAVRRWGNDTEMEAAWKLLKEATGKYFDAAVLFTCSQAIGYMGMYELELRRTASGRKAHFTDIAKLSKKLARKMSGTLEYPQLGPGDFFSHSELENISRSICNVAFGAETDFKDSAAREGMALNEYQVRWVLTQALPRIPAFLDRVANHAKNEANRKVRSEKVNRSNGKRALQAMYVASRMSVDLYDRAGVTLDSFVATLVNVAFRDANLLEANITSDAVSKARGRELAWRERRQK